MEQLRKLRKKNNLSMKELGKVLNVSESTISLYESGKREPDFETLIKLAEYFNVSTDYLLGRSDAKEQPNEPMPYIKHVAYEGKPIPQEILREVISDTRKIADLIDHAKLDAIEFIRDKPFDLEQLKMINTYIRALYYYNKYDKK